MFILPFLPSPDAIPTRCHDTEPQGMLFGQLPRGLPVYKENTDEDVLFTRLANRLAPLPGTAIH